MKSNNPILWVSLRFGSVAGILSVVLFTILYLGGRHPLLIPAYLDFRLLLFPIFIVFGIRDFREIRNRGILHFWQGFSVGTMIVLTLGFIMAVYIILLGGVFDHEFTSEYIAGTMQKIAETKESIISQVGEAAYNKSLEILPSTTLGDLSFDYFLKGLPLGFMLTIIISLLLRTPDNKN
ncbi:MAG TPA: DUF4199 domain-containing protein [Cyclobacteriaceae bacterium]|nr:DUF4199 domain-containing protein [Cyclobacteriaceae bacterium]